MIGFQGLLDQRCVFGNHLQCVLGVTGPSYLALPVKKHNFPNIHIRVGCDLCMDKHDSRYYCTSVKLAVLYMGNFAIIDLL